MIRQLLFFKFKPQVTENQIDNCFSEYKNLVGITALLSVEVNKNISTEGFDKGFTHAAIASFSNKKAVEEFLINPEHVAFADNILNPMLGDFALLEIEVT